MTKAPAKKLSTRKRLTQKRSREKFEMILSATRDLLKESGGVASAKLTTQKIAEQSGVAIGSLYQYFPNVESVLYELYRGFAEAAQKVIKYTK